MIQFMNHNFSVAHTNFSIIKETDMRTFEMHSTVALRQGDEA